MWTFRKAVLAAASLICFFFLLRSLSSSSLAPIPDRQLIPENVPKIENSYSGSSPAREEMRKQRTQSQAAENAQLRPLRDRLQYQFPYNLQTRFPAYIWQTWKYDPSSSRFEDRLRSYEASWTENHPGFVHEVVTDENAVYLINHLYAGVPEVVEAYKAMPLPVLKADYFRYLILLARGGIYSDIDTLPLKPATEWLPLDYDTSNVGLIVGIEADPDRPDWQDWYSRRIQFCQWTIQSKPGHPVLRDIVARITEDTLRMKKTGDLKPGSLPTSKSVVEFTGPAIWTDVIFSYFNDRRYFDLSANAEQNITWRDFTGLTEARKVGDVIVLPITSFSPGVGQMGAGEIDDPMAFVRHIFDGSWKPESERQRMEA